LPGAAVAPGNEFINTAEEAVRFVKQFHSASLKIILDVKAMSRRRNQFPDHSGIVPHFGYLHANDKNLKDPGSENRLQPNSAALLDVGLQRMDSVEVFNFDEGPEAIATRSVDYLRKTFTAPGITSPA